MAPVMPSVMPPVFAPVFRQPGDVSWTHPNQPVGITLPPAMIQPIPHVTTETEIIPSLSFAPNATIKKSYQLYWAFIGVSALSVLFRSTRTAGTMAALATMFLADYTYRQGQAQIQQSAQQWRESARVRKKRAVAAATLLGLILGALFIRGQRIHISAFRLVINALSATGIASGLMAWRDYTKSKQTVR